MEPERWRQVEDVFQSALECDPERRSAFLDSACTGDKLLREEVESLLASFHDQRFTDAQAFGDGLRLLEQRQSLAGRHIGPYRIIREIGEGGMGVVYLAARADDVFKKQVAIKVIPRGLDTESIVLRFRGERQILASLEHPNITRLLDGGTTEDGLPYFVMEYVKGQPIVRYCEERKGNIAERLRLFRSVCAAVHYAHQNLIIHRDIKPGNILVTAEGIPMLLDFGIAKLLAAEAGEATAPTRSVARWMTPTYASPEQIRGGAVTTATDVYSLGVLLYVLLTGHQPYQLNGSPPAEVDRIICQEEPKRPSVAADPALGRRLRGDLDNIVLMAMRKEPQRRYGSAEQFSEDIRRHLEGLPVTARPDTVGYRTAKFIQRNKAWVTMAAITFLSLASGIAVSLQQTHVARQQRDAARLEQAKASRINAFLQEMVGYAGVGSALPGHKYNATVAEMLDDAAKRVEAELSDQPEVKAELLTTIGRTYAGQGKLEPAAHYLAEAYDLNLKLYGPGALKTAGVMMGFSNLAHWKGDVTAEDSWAQKAIPIFRKHANDADSEIPWIVAALSDAAFAKRALAQLNEAEALWREALSYAPRLPAKDRWVGIAPKTYLAQLYVDRGDVEKAGPLAFEALQELRAGGQRFSPAQSLLDLGNVRRLERRYAEAEPLIRDGTRLYVQLQGDSHPNVLYALYILSSLHYDEGRYDLAEQDARGVLKIVEKLPKGSIYWSTAYAALGRVFNKTGRSREAEPLLREALAIRQKSGRRNDVAIISGYLGECLITQRRYAEAEPLLKESYEILRSVHVPQSPILKEARERLASLYAAWGKPPESIQ